MTTSARTPLRSACSAASSTARGGQRDDGQVDRVGDLLDRAVRAHAGDRLAVPVHRVRGAGEVAREDVPEQLAADRAAPPRGADHGDARGSKNGRSDAVDGGVVALLDALAVALRRRDRELHLDLAALELARQLEAGGLEDAEHAPVVRQHLGDEALDPDLRRALGELLEQPRADAAALVLVGDRERRLGEARVAQPHVVRDRDDALAAVLGERPEQRAALVPVRLEQRLDEPRPRAAGSRGSAGRGCARRGRAKKSSRASASSGRGRAQPQRAAVAEDDVDVRRVTASFRTAGREDAPALVRYAPAATGLGGEPSASVRCRGTAGRRVDRRRVGVEPRRRRA